MRSAPCIREGSVYLLTEAATDLLTDAKNSGYAQGKIALGSSTETCKLCFGQTPFNSLPYLRQEKLFILWPLTILCCVQKYRNPIS